MDSKYWRDRGRRTATPCSRRSARRLSGRSTNRPGARVRLLAPTLDRRRACRVRRGARALPRGACGEPPARFPALADLPRRRHHLAERRGVRGLVRAGRLRGARPAGPRGRRIRGRYPSRNRRRPCGRRSRRPLPAASRPGGARGRSLGRLARQARRRLVRGPLCAPRAVDQRGRSRPLGAPDGARADAGVLPTRPGPARAPAELEPLAVRTTRVWP